MVLIPDFKSFFKLNFSMVEFLWVRIANGLSKDRSLSPIHLLWTLYFLKTRNPRFDEISVTLGTNTNTLKIHVETTLQLLLSLLPSV
jgi:hypothetical protein